MPETCIMPEHKIRPKVTETQIPFYPDPLMKICPRPAGIKTQDDRKINLNLDLEINKDLKESAVSRRQNIRNISKTGQISIARATRTDRFD